MQGDFHYHLLLSFSLYLTVVMQEIDLIKKSLPLALIGAVAATICDANHMYTETLSYPVPYFYEQVWRVFLGFSGAFLVMAVSYHAMVTALSKPFAITKSTRPGGIRAFVETLLLFMMVYLLSGFGNREPLAMSIIFYSSFLVRWLFTYDKGFMLLFAIILGIVGMVAEGLLSKIGFVQYRAPEIFEVPYWLGGLYMHGALALRAGMRYFVYQDSSVGDR